MLARSALTHHHARLPTCQPEVSQQCVGITIGLLQVDAIKQSNNSCPATATQELNCDNYCNMPLYFKNSCKLPVQTMLAASLREDEAPSYCLNPEHLMGQWCTRPAMSLAPGETSAEPLAVTDNRIFFHLSWATDGNNRTVSSDTSPGDEAAWMDTKSGLDCKEGSRATCKPFSKVCAQPLPAVQAVHAGTGGAGWFGSLPGYPVGCRLALRARSANADGCFKGSTTSAQHLAALTGDCYRRPFGLPQVHTDACFPSFTYELGCPNFVDCSIPHCQVWYS